MKNEMQAPTLQELQSDLELTFNAYCKSLNRFVDAWAIPKFAETGTCGDDRLDIVSAIHKAFTVEDNKLTPTDEVDLPEMDNQIKRYTYLMNHVTEMGNAVALVNDCKLPYGIELNSKVTIFSKYIAFKMAGKDKDKFKAVEKTVLSYFDPNEKRKQNTLAKKKEARSIKKG